MKLSAVAAALRALADALEAPGDSTVSPGPYDRDHLPPGAASWRAVLDAGRRGDLKIDLVGRRAVVTHEAWSAYVAGCRRRRRPVEVRDADREALAKMGVVVPMRAAGGAR